MTNQIPQEPNLMPMTASDELSFLRHVGRLLGQILPAVGEIDGAYAIACNCVTVFYATRGQLAEVRLPEDLLRVMDLARIADLAEDYHSRFGNAQQWEQAVNESCEQEAHHVGT